MPEMNPELLKQLLADFEEKQAVTTEEINEIEKQIEELRARIELSRDRLKEVERDRDKIGAMKARYAEGDWNSVLQDLAKQKAQPPEGGRQSERSEPEPPAPKAREEKAKKGKSSAREVSDNGSGKNVEPEAPQEPPAPPSPPESEPEAPPAPPPPTPALAPTMEMDMPSTLGAPSALSTPSPSEGLFSFSQATQQQTGELPWAPTPGLSWDSVNAQSFPPADVPEPQPTGYALTPDGNNPFLEAGSKLGIPAPQSFGQLPQQAQQDLAAPGAPEAPASPEAPGGPLPQAPSFPSPFSSPTPLPPGLTPLPVGTTPAPSSNYGNPDNLSTAFDEEFDIAAALRGENEPEKEEGDVKKINDALRGLFTN